MHTLSVTLRTETGTRVDGQMPAIVYGPKQAPTPISVDARVFEKTLKQAGESSIIELTGLDTPIQVLIHEVDRDPITHTPRHADFYAVEKGAKVQVAVPIVFEGEAPAIKEGANLVKVLHEIEVESEPTKLPQEIVVDVSTLLAIGDQIRVSDIKAPAGVVFLTDAEEVIVLAQEVVEEAETEATMDMDSIEVEQKGKGEEEGDEAAS
ncbi:50S ribosomal protein L25 [Patescibacteria group bacterium]|nr:50S ribosomal protein L25 [Patescibacteria group bacterium]MBU1755063.1 50S ribosomal protein L25 [Patescibacteria group bacterium]